jgi:hypothetical protein
MLLSSSKLNSERRHGSHCRITVVTRYEDYFSSEIGPSAPSSNPLNPTWQGFMLIIIARLYFRSNPETTFPYSEGKRRLKIGIGKEHYC